jgi:hypothetical protein
MSAAVRIPRRPSEVTRTWLATVLSAAGEPVVVRDVDVRAVGTGQTGATYRIQATYARARPGLPDSFIIKLPAQDDAVRDRCVLGYRSECAFYAVVAQRVQIPAPECFHCDITEDAANYALLLADQAPAVQGDQLGGCGLAEARLAVRALAGLHGPTWCDTAWRTFPGLSMTLTDDAAIKGLGDVAQMSADITLDKLGAGMRPEDHKTLIAAMSVVTPWLRGEPDRFALMHGDYRLDNMLFNADGSEVTVVDWQTLGVGLPARDLAYFTGTSLEPDVRSAIEGELVDQYHQSLVEYGVNEYDRETCWQDYRYGMLQALLIPCLGIAFAVDTERGQDMFLAMLRRGCQAIRELQSLDLIDTAAVTSEATA